MSEPWETTPNYADAYNRGASGLSAPLDPRLGAAYDAGKEWMTPPPQTPFTPVSPVGAPTYGPYHGGGSGGTLTLRGAFGRLGEGVGWLPVMIIGLLVAAPQTIGAMVAGLVGGSLALLASRVFSGAARFSIGGAFKASFFAMLACQVTMYVVWHFGGSTVRQLDAALLPWAQSLLKGVASRDVAQLVSTGLIAQVTGIVVYSGVNARLLRGPFAGVVGYLKSCVLTLCTIAILMVISVGMAHYVANQRLAAQQKALAQLQAQLIAQEQNSRKPRKVMAAPRKAEPRATQDASNLRQP